MFKPNRASSVQRVTLLGSVGVRDELRVLQVTFFTWVLIKLNVIVSLS